MSANGTWTCTQEGCKRVHEEPNASQFEECLNLKRYLEDLHKWRKAHSRIDASGARQETVVENMSAGQNAAEAAADANAKENAVAERTAVGQVAPQRAAMEPNRPKQDTTSQGGSAKRKLDNMESSLNPSGHKYRELDAANLEMLGEGEGEE